MFAYFLDRDARAALDDAFHDRGDLISRQWIDDLLTLVDQLRLILIVPFSGIATLTNTLVVPIDRVAPAVLDAIDQGGLNALAAVGEHRIARDHAEHRGLASAQRHRQERRQVVVDAETLGVFKDQRHAYVASEPHRHLVDRMFDPEAQRMRTARLSSEILRG